MNELVFMLEEASAAELLKIFLPRILGNNIKLTFITFQGKSDLEKRLQRKLRAYQNPEDQFIIMRDQDSGDCRVIKERLSDIASNSTDRAFRVIIACRALESWYLAQLDAVEKGLDLQDLARYQNKKSLRQPDKLSSPDQYLSKMCNSTYTKVGGSRKIAAHLDPDCARSPSFKHFIASVRSLCDEVKKIN